jgi:hypothetical protein
LDVVREEWGTRTRGLELDEERAAEAEKLHQVHQCDALIQERWPFADLIITNPPYKFALDFVACALHTGRDVAMLLRLNFLASQQRAAFHKQHPSDVYVLPRRPSFAHKRTDSTEYAWMVWGPGRGGRIAILDCECPRLPVRDTSRTLPLPFPERE